MYYQTPMHGLGLAPCRACSMGDDSSPSGTTNATTWVAGGLLVAAAIALFALEKKGPRAVRR